MRNFGVYTDIGVYFSSFFVTVAVALKFFYFVIEKTCHILLFFLITTNKTKQNNFCTLFVEDFLLWRPHVKKFRERQLYLSWNS